MEGTGMVTSKTDTPRKRARTNSRVPYQRKRAVVACTVCRTRRTKCDNKKPRCSFCETVGAECVTIQNDPSTYDLASLQIIERLERIENLVCSRYRTETSIQSTNATEDHLDDQSEQLTITQTLQDVLQWPALAEIGASATGTGEVPSPLSLASTSEAEASSVAGISVELDLKEGLALMDDYLKFTHVKNPILDESSLRTMVTRACIEGFAWDSESCLVLLVFALGATSGPFDPVAPRSAQSHVDVADGLFRAVKKRIGLTIDAPCLLQAQCYFLSGVFLMCRLRAYDAWKMFLQALSACQGFGCVTRSHTAEAHGTSLRASLEERVYWSSWKSERELRLELGMNDFSSTRLSHPALYPSVPHDSEGEQLRSWYFYLSEIAIWRLRSTAEDAIVRLKGTTTNPEDLIELVGRLEQQAEQWQRSLAPPVTLGNLHGASHENDVLTYVLRGAITYYYEMIMFPFIFAVVNKGSTSQAVRMYAEKGLQWHLNRLIINSPGFRHRHHGTWLMQQSSCRSACILLAVGMTPSAAELLPCDWLRMVDQTIDMLAYWSTSMRDAQSHLGLLQKFRAHFLTVPRSSAW